MRARTGTGPFRALLFAVGSCAIGVGAALTLRPFSSLDALTFFVAASLILAGFSELLGSVEGDWTEPSRLAGGLLLAAGLVAALAPGLTVRGIAFVVGVGMLLGGAARVSAVWRGQVEERYASAVGGLAGVVFGILALAWPDVTILVVALLVGPVAIVFGALQVLRALRGPKPEKPATTSRPRVWLRGVRASAALVFALLLVLVSALVHKGSPTVPAFYSGREPCPTSPACCCGTSRPRRACPQGRGRFASSTRPRGWTERSPRRAGWWSSPRPRRPVLARSCCGSTAPPAWRRNALRRSSRTHSPRATCSCKIRSWPTAGCSSPPTTSGWVPHPPHPYLVGIPEARSALDAVRAARQLSSIKLGGQTVVWGHSQGGGAALWTGIEAPSYAPNIALSGVAALAPASDLVSLANGLESSKSGMLFASFMVAGYSNAYTDVAFNDYVRASAQAIVRAVVGRCLSEPATLLSLPAVLTGEQIFSRHVNTGPLAMRLAQNVPEQVTRTPTLIAQGEADSLVLPPVQSAFAHKLCQADEKLEYRTCPALDHVSVVEPNSPLIPYLLSWTQNRFQGAAAPSDCSNLPGG